MEQCYLAIIMLVKKVNKFANIVMEQCLENFSSEPKFIAETEAKLRRILL